MKGMTTASKVPEAMTSGGTAAQTSSAFMTA